MKKLLLILGVFALLTSCQPTQNELSPEKRQEIADTIKKEFNNLMGKNQDFTVENFDRMQQAWVESDDKVWMENPALWLNMMTLMPDKESMEVWRPKPNSTRAATNYFIDEDYVAVISAECAVYVLKGTFTVTSKDGITTDPIPLSGSYVYVMRDGEWKMLHMHQSWED